MAHALVQPSKRHGLVRLERFLTLDCSLTIELGVQHLHSEVEYRERQENSDAVRGFNTAENAVSPSDPLTRSRLSTRWGDGFHPQRTKRSGKH